MSLSRQIPLESYPIKADVNLSTLPQQFLSLANLCYHKRFKPIAEGENGLEESGNFFLEECKTFQKIVTTVANVYKSSNSQILGEKQNVETKINELKEEIIRTKQESGLKKDFASMITAEFKACLLALVVICANEWMEENAPEILQRYRNGVEFERFLRPISDSSPKMAAKLKKSADNAQFIGFAQKTWEVVNMIHNHLDIDCQTSKQGVALTAAAIINNMWSELPVSDKKCFKYEPGGKNAVETDILIAIFQKITGATAIHRPPKSNATRANSLPMNVEDNQAHVTGKRNRKRKANPSMKVPDKLARTTSPINSLQEVHSSPEQGNWEDLHQQDCQYDFDFDENDYPCYYPNLDVFEFDENLFS